MTFHPGNKMKMRKYNQVSEERTSLGARIRQLRKDSGKSIKEMTSEIRVTGSLISQIERGKANPSMTTLWTIAHVLKVPIGEFFEPSHSESPVVRQKERKVINIKDGMRFYLLSPNLRGKLEVLYILLEPGAMTGEELYTHAGEECGLVIKGKIKVTLGDHEYSLKKGDSITFQSTRPHKVQNIGKTEAIIVWADTPPSF